MIWNLLLTGDGGGDKPTSPIGTYIMLGVIVLALIGMFVWTTISNKKKQKAAKEALDKIKIGDRVKTIGGICGFIVELRDKDNTFVLETGLEGKTCYIRFDRGAIYQTASEGVETADSVKEEKVEEAKPEIVENVESVETAEPVATTEEVVEEAPAKDSKKK